MTTVLPSSGPATFLGRANYPFCETNKDKEARSPRLIKGRGGSGVGEQADDPCFNSRRGDGRRSHENDLGPGEKKVRSGSACVLSILAPARTAAVDRLSCARYWSDQIARRLNEEDRGEGRKTAPRSSRGSFMRTEQCPFTVCGTHCAK